MRAPDLEVTLDGGERVPLATLYQHAPLALVFLRHLGCVFCREQVAMLRQATDVNLFFVTRSPAEEAATFRVQTYAPQRFIADPEGRLYEWFGLEQGGWSQLLGPRVMARAVGATLAGHGFARPPSDPKQMPGAVVLTTKGEVAWRHRARDAADNLTEATLRDQLKAATLAESNSTSNP